MCLVRKMNSPAFASLRHPLSTQEGGALQHAFCFPYFLLLRIVQDEHRAVSSPLRGVPPGRNVLTGYCSFDLNERPPPSPLRGASPVGGQRVSGIETFYPCTLRQSALYVPCAKDEPTRLRFAPAPSQNLGGLGRWHAFIFSHLSKYVSMIRLICASCER